MTREEKKNELIGMFCTGTMYIGDIIDDAMDFAVDKACEWLKLTYDDIGIEWMRGYTCDDLVEQFKKTMEQ